MEQSPSTSQETPHALWKPEVHYRVYKGPPSVSVLSQVSPIHASHFNSFLTRTMTGKFLLIII